MASRTVKIAITIPRDIFKVLESLRQRLKVSRSSLIDQAVTHWIHDRQKTDLIHRYEEGYRKDPEDTKEIAALGRVQLTSIPEGDW